MEKATGGKNATERDNQHIMRGDGRAEHRTQQADVGRADYPHSMRVQ